MVNGTTAYVGGEGGALLVSTTANQVPDTTPPTGVISGPAHLVTGQFGTYVVNAADNAGGSGVDASSFVWSTPGQPAQPGTTAHFAFGTAGTFTISVAFKDLAGNPGSATFSVTVTSPVIVIPPPSGSRPVSTTTGGATITIFRHVTVKGRKGRFIPVVLKTTKPRKFVISLVTIAEKHKRSKTLATLKVTIRSGKHTVHLNVPKSVKSGSYSLVVKIFATGRHSHRVGRSVKQVFVLT